MVACCAGPLEASNGKARRRPSPLDRLKLRSPSDRWTELRQQWNIDTPAAEPKAPAPAAEPPASSPVPATESLTSDPFLPPLIREASTAEPTSPDTRHADGNDLVAPDSVAADLPTEVPSISAPESEWPLIPVPAETVPAESVRRVPLLQPQQVIGEVPPLPPLKAEPGAAGDLTSPHPGAGTLFTGMQLGPSADNVDVGEHAPLPSPDGAAEGTRPARSLLPKSITSILPFHDYSPDGADPCEFLCPLPEGCPEAEEALPCPEFIDLPSTGMVQRVYADSHIFWEASNLHHNPLYFEDPALERYGHTHNCVVQPLVSMGRFGVQLIGLPYQLALHPVHECQYTLGWFRPGECVPYQYYLPPWNTKAALTAAAAYTGLIYVIP
jgi:hypothetical protein